MNPMIDQDGFGKKITMTEMRPLSCMGYPLRMACLSCMACLFGRVEAMGGTRCRCASQASILTSWLDARARTQADGSAAVGLPDLNGR